MLTDNEIERAKMNTNYGSLGAHHEHNDCIRMAHEWLDAQIKNTKKCSKNFPLKHLIEEWCGRYVSSSDVRVAATLHPDISGEYPNFNISVRLTQPSKSRLEGISEAFTHGYNDRHSAGKYTYRE